MKILYLMVHFPCVFWVKIGITGKSSRKRAAGINREMWGVPIPVFGLPIPAAEYFEAMLHRQCKVINVRFYKGSGHSEWFWFPAIIPYLIVIALGAAFWLCVAMIPIYLLSRLR